MAENAVRNIISGRKLGTFFTDTKNGGISTETAAEQGALFLKNKIFQVSLFKKSYSFHGSFAIQS
jgi:hypothetical protein